MLFVLFEMRQHCDTNETLQMNCHYWKNLQKKIKVQKLIFKQFQAPLNFQLPIVTR